MKTMTDEELAKRIDFGIKRGVAKALKEHKLAGHSIYVSREGKIIEIKAQDIEIPEIHPEL